MKKAAKEAREINLFHKQGEALLSDKRYILVCCGVQSGKTFLGATWARSNMQKFPNFNGLVSAPTYKILEQSTLDKLFTLFPELRQYYKQQKNVIELPGGGHVYIRSADQPLGIEGMTIHWGWLDEYGQAPRMAWTVCRSRVAATRGRLMITTTPYALNWLYQEVYMPWFKKEVDDVSFHTWRSVDNPYFDEEHYISEKQRLSPEEFKRRYEGEFSRMEGLVYTDFNSNLIVKPFGFKPIKVLAGIDFGFANPCAVVVLAQDFDGTWYVIDEYYKTGKTQDEVNEECLYLQNKRKIDTWYPDIAEPDRIESMRKAGLMCREEKKDLTGGIDKVRALFRMGKLKVFDKCVNLINELQLYCYPEEFKEKEEPIPENNHACDALRYALAGERVLEGSEWIGLETKSNKKPLANDFAINIQDIINENNTNQDKDAWLYT